MPLDLARIREQYGDIVADVEIVGVGTAQKTRLVFNDGSYLDAWFSGSGRYSFHWERKHLDGTFFRFDNAPHHRGIKTFPHHLHNGSEGEITASWIDPRPEKALFQVLDFVRERFGR